MHGMHCRETETGSPQCTGSPPSRKIEKFGLGWFTSPLALRAFPSDFRRARARKQWFFRRCMQNGPADQADLHPPRAAKAVGGSRSLIALLHKWARAARPAGASAHDYRRAAAPTRGRGVRD